LSLCVDCNDLFDAHDIAIEPGTFKLLISKHIFSKKIDQVASIRNFGDINKLQKKLLFKDSSSTPTEQLLERRLRKFKRKQNNRASYQSSSEAAAQSSSQEGKLPSEGLKRSYTDAFSKTDLSQQGLNLMHDS
jgi:hypothetical protein